MQTHDIQWTENGGTFLRRKGNSLSTRRAGSVLNTFHTVTRSLLKQPVRLALVVIPFCRWKCKMELPKGSGQNMWVKSGRTDSDESSVTPRTTQLTSP